MNTTTQPENAEWSSVQPIIDFDDLQIEILPEANSDAPWDNCDGYEHTVAPVERYDDQRNASGYFMSRHRAGVIKLDFDSYSKKVGKRLTGYGTDGFFHARGASKQVAFEAEKENERRTREQLAKWYGDGWQAYGIVVKFNGKHVDSCWGFYDDADEGYSKQIVMQGAVAELESRGYIVRGVPAWVNGHFGVRTIPGNVHWFDFGNTEGECHEFNPAKRDRKPLNLP